MSLGNLPRAITQKIIRPSPMQAEREEFERVQLTALHKAISLDEVPAKEKHIRTLIIGTFQDRSANTFWAFVNSRIPVQGNPVVAWKFCYVLHKLLRDGHPNTVKDSIRFQQFMVDLGRLWGHLKVGHGPLITKYCQLLAVKLDFHRKNPRFPGNLHITNDELARIAEDDVNNYFQLSVEVFDYMECILDLAAVVFGSFDMSRANSMTSAGQCRLVVLIPCILDTCQLYDFIVKMMFRLHTALPQDTLTGHRERFVKQFKLLQHLYYSASHLQFFKNLIQIPSLPERAPNFFSAVDIKQHVTPVAKVQEVVEEPIPEPTVGVLIETASPVKAEPASANGNDRPWLDDFVEKPSARGDENRITEKDRVIEELLYEIDRLRRDGERIKSDDMIIIEDLRNRVVELERDSEEQRAQSDMEKQTMMQQIEQSSKNPQVLANFEELNKRSRAAEEKMKKMRDVYNKLSDQHKELIRQKADADKQYKQTKKSLDDLEREKSELSVRILNFDTEKEQLQTSISTVSAESQREIQEKTTKCRNLENQLAGVQAELDSALVTRVKLHEEHETLLRSSKEAEEQHRLTKQTVDDLERQKNELSIQILKLNTEKEDLQKSAGSASVGFQQEIREKTDQCRTLEGQLSTLQTELGSALVSRQKLQEAHVVLLQSSGEADERHRLTKLTVEELERQKTELCVKISNLETEKGELQTTSDLTLTELRKVLEEKSEHCRTLAAQLTGLQIELDSALVYREKLEVEVVALTQSGAYADEQYKLTKALVDELERQKNDLSIHIRNLDTEKEQLMSSASLTTAELHKEIQDKSAQCKSLETQLAGSQAELASTTITRENLQEAYAVLERANADMNEEHKRTKQALDEVERKKNELSVQILTLGTEKEQLQNSATSTTSELRREIEEKVSQCRDFETQLANLQSELESALGAGQTLEAEYGALMRSSTDANEQHRLTRLTLEDVERQKNELSVQIRNLSTEKEQLQTSASSTTSELRNEIQEKTTLCQSLENKLAGVQVELDTMIVTRDKLHEEFTALKHSSAASDEQHRLTLKTVEDLEHQKNELSVQLVSLGAEKEQLQNSSSITLSELQKEIQDKALRCRNLESKLAGLQVELDTAKITGEKLQAEHAALVRSHADLSGQQKLTNKALDDMERERNELNVRLLNVSTEKEQVQKAAHDSSATSQQEIQEKMAQCRSLENKVEGLQVELDSALVTREKLVQEHEAALQRHKALQEQLDNAEMDLDSAHFQQNLQIKSLRQQFLNVICSAAAEEIQHCINTWEQPAFSVLTSTPEYLLLSVDPVLEHLQKLRQISTDDEEQLPQLAKEIQLTFGHMTHCLIACMETAHMAPVDLTDEFSFLASKLGEFSLTYLTGFRQDPQAVQPILGQVQESLEVLQHLSNVLIPKVEDVRVDEVADQVEKELHDMDKAIEAAALKIEEMLANTRTRDSGVKLEVNAKILDSCTTLMTAVRVLVRKSRALQQEIVAAGKGFSSPKEFYKRNHRWTEGLISAAKTIGLGANVLLEAADKVVGGRAKFEELVVASQEISSGTVQLVVSSRVKADKNSKALAEMSVASKSVTQATGNVVASAKACAQLVEEKADFDFTGVSITKIKKIEMDAQVRVLELESLLTKEREKLSSIRRQHYALSGGNENEA